MRVTFDRSTNAAYIYLREIGPGEAVRQHQVELDATQVLPRELVDGAERL